MAIFHAIATEQTNIIPTTMRLIITKTTEKSWLFDGTYEEFLAKIGLDDYPELRQSFKVLIEDEYIADDELGDAIEKYLERQAANPTIDCHVFKEVK